MKDMQAHARKIRSDAAECTMLSNLVSEESRHVFARIAEHLHSLALEIETEMVTTVADEPTAAPNQQVDFAAHHPATTEQQQAARSWHRYPWSLIAALLVIGGGVFWSINRAEVQSLSQPNLPPRTAPASRDSNQELAALLSGERAERKAFGEQLNAVIAQLDSLARDLDELKSFRAGTPRPPVSSSKGAAEHEDRSAGAEPPAVEPGTARTDASNPASEASVAATEGPPSAVANPVGERSAAVSPIAAELDTRKPAAGPTGCTHFRSFDPVSGTYTTFDGRRRQCR
jgi:hypothetical protein